LFRNRLSCGLPLNTSVLITQPSQSKMNSLPVITPGSYLYPGDNYDPNSHHNKNNTAATVFLYVTFGLFVAATIGFFISFIVAKTEKIRNMSLIYVAITTTAATAYLSMAFQQGYVLKENGRQFYYGRYVDWAITTPLLLIELFSLAGAGWNVTLIAIVFDLAMIITGLFGALSARVAMRWIWFGLGCLAMLPIIYLILVYNRRFLNDRTRTAYTVQAVALTILWCLYPLCWGLTEGGYNISEDFEHLWFCILDVLAKIVYGISILFVFREAIPYSEGYVADAKPGVPRHPTMWTDPSKMNEVYLSPSVYRRGKSGTASKETALPQ